MFINLSNHPSSLWKENQINAAMRYGVIVDLPFPVVKEEARPSDIIILVKDYCRKIDEIASNKPCTVHTMGEMTFTYAMVNALKAKGYTCVASTTKRIVEELPDGVKNVKFEFCQFREY